MKKNTLLLIFTLSIFATVSTFGQKNPDLAPSPPMGWNSWNFFGKQDITEKKVYEVIDAMVEHGLRYAGIITLLLMAGGEMLN